MNTRGAIAAAAAKSRLYLETEDFATKIGTLETEVEDLSIVVTDLKADMVLLDARVVALEGLMTSHTHSYDDSYRDNADPLTVVTNTTTVAN